MKTMGKTALVTGASSGIGKATVRQLLSDGHIVYALARRVERMQDLAQLGAKVIPIDVTKDETMVQAVEEIFSARGAVDILVNNAGYAFYGAVEDVPISEAKRQFEVNVFGLARLTQLVLPKMRENRWGKIVNISSMGGKIYTPMAAWYHATKFAVEALSDCLRIETKPFGIDVIIIEPGVIKSEWSDIAAENLMKVSGDSAYAEIARSQAELLKETYENKASEPEIIAQAISRAIKARRPKTRYALPGDARSAIRARWLLPDKLFDSILYRQTKAPRKL